MAVLVVSAYRVEKPQSLQYLISAKIDDHCFVFLIAWLWICLISLERGCFRCEIQDDLTFLLSLFLNLKAAPIIVRPLKENGVVLCFFRTVKDVERTSSTCGEYK